MADRRPPRTRVVGSEPIPVADLRARPDDHSVEPRVDGAGGSPRAGFRRRDRSTEPLPMSTVQWLEALVCFAPLWEIAGQVDTEIGPPSGVGRRRECTAFEMLLFEVASWETRSYRAAHRALADPHTWRRLTKRVSHAWPDHSERRLSTEGPSRSQHHRFRTRHLEDEGILDQLRAQYRRVAHQTADALGQFDPSGGSLTHPQTTDLIAGDATWMPALYDTPPDEPVVDLTTGEIIERRSDPDAVPFHRRGQTCGRYLVSALARNPHPHERVILDLDFTPPTGRSDATVFTDMALEVFDDRPAARGTVYDMALHAADIDRVLDTGRLPIAKVQRTRKATPAMVNLGEHTLRLRDGSTRTEVVTALDGTPCVTITNTTGTAHLMPLNRRQSKARPISEGATVYGRWEVPDHAAVPRPLHGAAVMIRHSSTESEREHRTRRTRALRPIPESDPDFDRLYGLREDTESMHHHLKERLWNGRARCVGLKRQRINLHGYQLRTSMAALIAWHLRTDADLTRWFGRWRPPDRSQPVDA